MVEAQVLPNELLWFAVKLKALITYIVSGSFANKRAKTSAVRVIRVCLALLIFICIVNLAISKNAIFFQQL